ncbi:developmentally regulated G-protein 1 [Striga asiatica]|uniref:Developmentally regulated G-protein 1 n=1 Tax=Striga asiatica TaxID=4170 RepID=A0A5A7RBC6_STRAF|nr:developmentally regulated G-protein 1 [Striga asiatica]
MAIRLSLCSALPLPLSHGSSTNKVPKKIIFFMCSKNGISVNPQIKLSHHDHKKNKIFEDRSAGIVCYRNENGEITCEGYDEGPRFHQQISRFGDNRVAAEVLGSGG